jgi:hypothetical protein
LGRTARYCEGETKGGGYTRVHLFLVPNVSVGRDFSEVCALEIREVTRSELGGAKGDKACQGSGLRR